MRLIFVLVVMTISLSEISASSRSSFGEECGKTKKCDRKAWLYCYEGFCDCSKKEEMFYDEDKAKCVTKSGERCKYGGDEDGESSLVEITDCVDHSECGEDGICICDSKYHEVFNGTCELSKLFGDTCSDEDKCSKFLHLHCVNGTCDCKEGISTYSAAVGQCVGSLNQTCIKDKCLDGGECKDGICVCDSNHYGDCNNICAPKKGGNENCESDSECINRDMANLKCVNGKCLCKEGFTYSKVQMYAYEMTFDLNVIQYHDPDMQEVYNQYFHGPFVELCAPLVGSHCPDQYCPPNAKCRLPLDELNRHYQTNRHNIWTGEALRYESAVCECSEEFPVVNKDNSKCGKKWMDGNGHQDRQILRCANNDDCVNNLVCYESRCKCLSPGHQKINNLLDFCLSKTGGPCSINSDCAGSAFCKLLPNSTIGHCHCNEGFVDSPDGECKGSYGTRCDYKGDVARCDQNSGLVCVNEKCICKDEVMNKYSEELRKCVGLVGAQCQGNNSCIANAECPMSTDYQLPRRCKCTDGFVETVHFTCDSKNIEL